VAGPEGLASGHTAHEQLTGPGYHRHVEIHSCRATSSGSEPDTSRGPIGGPTIEIHYRLLSLPENHPAKEILPVSFRKGDQHAQPGEQTPENRRWADSSNGAPWSLGQHLARQLANIPPADPSEGFESMIQTTSSQFPGRIEMPPCPEALAAAQSLSHGLAIWSDGSKLENGRCEAGLAWQEPGGTWKTQGFPLGRGYVVFDAELLGVVRNSR